MTRNIATALVLAGLLMGQAQAQDGRAGAPDGVPSDPPAAPESKVERQRNNAAKLAGLLAFVRANCPDLQPNDARFKTVVASLGVAQDDLQAGDLQVRALAYADAYAKDIPANCARATENFGAGGRTIPDLLAKR